ncbi:MAG: 2-oxo acid dehydrogenase subunit E2 [Terriglobia bacterium]
MATEFRLPELGENIKSGDLVRMLVSPGDTVNEDQPVMELETDKATIEVPSPVSGKVKEVFVKDGDKLQVGQLVFTVDSNGAASEKPREAAPATAAKATAPEEAEESPRAPAAHAKSEPGESSNTHERRSPEPLPEAEPEPAEMPRLESRAPVIPFPQPISQLAGGAPVPAAPSVRRVAREIGVDVSRVQGTGPGGRISADDVKNYARQIIRGGGAAGGAGIAAGPLPDFSRWGEVEHKAMSQVRRKTAEHMAQAWANVPQVTQYDKADTTQLEEIRRQFGDRVSRAGGKLTVTAIALKVVASALRVFPQCAASIDMAANEVVFKKYCHIGVAVDTDRGLLVPVIRDVDRKNIIELSVELAALAEKARSRKLALEDMEGGVFTITNLGGIGGTYFSPIVNYPEAAILGISRSSTEAVYINGQLEPRLMLPLSLSYDHRLIDGADAIRFLRWVAEALEQPFLLPLQG